MIVGCISHIGGLKTCELQKIWFRVGNGGSKYILVHVIPTCMGSSLCDILPVMQYLTGNNAGSNFDTNLSELKQLYQMHISVAFIICLRRPRGSYALKSSQ